MAPPRLCRNTPKGEKEKAYFAGTEPSPKGLGWCARFESVGTSRKGLDGRTWVVVAAGVRNDILRWRVAEPSAKPPAARIKRR